MIIFMIIKDSLSLDIHIVIIKENFSKRKKNNDGGMKKKIQTAS